MSHRHTPSPSSPLKTRAESSNRGMAPSRSRLEPPSANHQRQLRRKQTADSREQASFPLLPAQNDARRRRVRSNKETLHTETAIKDSTATINHEADEQYNPFKDMKSSQLLKDLEEKGKTGARIKIANFGIERTPFFRFVQEKDLGRKGNNLEHVLYTGKLTLPKQKKPFFVDTEKVMERIISIEGNPRIPRNNLFEKKIVNLQKMASKLFLGRI
eukprot:TRINITY_DN24517_c0_g1_i1.p1 TRINITY_DN24517_c0_g1~~TRINITY_DN24517_c0_g1_i1.p1  ORF type:complete len:215 (-),score=35.03 TRINITY_DN24517_c0_g1_i1:89-733(-)